MTFDDIKRVNELCKTEPVKGKDYVCVNERVKAFRMVYPEGLISTEILFLNDGVATMKTSVFDDNGKLLATGLAQEKEGSTFINKTSFIENCETSAVGRALAMLGIGIDTSISSAEELQNALANQDEIKVPKKPATKKSINELKKKLADEKFMSKAKEVYAVLRELGVANDKDLDGTTEDVVLKINEAILKDIKEQDEASLTEKEKAGIF